MVKIKNVRPGILLIVDVGLKLAPGESVDLETLTPQTRKAVDDGLLACTDTTPAPKAEAKQDAKPEAKSESKSENKPKGKTAVPTAESKEATKKAKGQPIEEEQPQSPEEDPDAGTGDAKPEGESKESGPQGTDDAPE